MTEHSEPASVSTRHHLDSIQGLKGVAAFLVFLRHCLPIPGMETGQLAVRIFFILSGYFITLSLLKHCQKKNFGTGQVRYYAIHRLTRILPAWALVMLAGVVFSYEPLLQLMGWHLSMLLNVRMTLDGFAPFPTGHLWTVSLLVHFYLLWPLVIWIGGKKWGFRIALLMIVLGPAFRLLWLWGTDYPLGARLLLPGCADTLAAGALLALAPKDSLIRKWLLHRVTWILGLILLISVSVLKLLTPNGSPGQVVYLILFDVGIWMFAVPLVSCLLSGNGLVDRVLRIKPLVMLGTVSYGFYLFHPFIYAVLLNHLEFSPVLLAVATFVGTCILAGLSWKAVERPVMRAARP